MLVLSRKTGEELVIDGEIRVRVLRIAGGKVRIGIEAPDHCRIVRAELEKRGGFSPVPMDLPVCESTSLPAAALV
jgi:carbon storage regulator